VHRRGDRNRCGEDKQECSTTLHGYEQVYRNDKSVPLSQAPSLVKEAGTAFSGFPQDIWAEGLKATATGGKISSTPNEAYLKLTRATWGLGRYGGASSSAPFKDSIVSCQKPREKIDIGIAARYWSQDSRCEAPHRPINARRAATELHGMKPLPGNVDPDVAAGFGHEWSTFRQEDNEFSQKDRDEIFRSYFSIFPWNELPRNAVGIDVGCGSGRWSVMVAPRVGHLHLLDASADALAIARQNLAAAPNVSFHLASVDNIPVEDASLDFAFSLGVLHHLPDTAAGIRAVAAKLKPGAPFLIYLYYALDHRPWWYRATWRLSDHLRRMISRLSPRTRYLVSQIIAVGVYWPIARFAALVERAGYPPSAIPLEAYRHRELYVMRTDAYDRFCTKLERRFTRLQIEAMLGDAGFGQIFFSDSVPYWCVVGRRLATTNFPGQRTV
jgi:SAM-dependent methyltransferase